MSFPKASWALSESLVFAEQSLEKIHGKGTDDFLVSGLRSQYGGKLPENKKNGQEFNPGSTWS
jgi:hypothetical protein